MNGEQIILLTFGSMSLAIFSIFIKIYFHYGYYKKKHDNLNKNTRYSANIEDLIIMIWFPIMNIHEDKNKKRGNFFLLMAGLFILSFAISFYVFIAPLISK